jgi:hypothetical protein
MKYADLVEDIRNFEDTFWFGEYVYFKALEKLEPVRTDLNKLETKEHVKGIIKIFLIQWGMMGGTVNRKDLDWEQLAKQIRSSKEAFRKLQGKSLLDIDLDDEGVKDAIKRTYEAAKIKHIGPTAISKILHLLNPEIYVMWDEEIRKKYKKKYKITKNAEGYLNFLNRMQVEVKEALGERAKEKGCSEREIAEEICRELPSKKLGQEYSRKTLAKLVDEYNWWFAHKKNDEEERMQ